jgi:hypothetical protein
MHPILKTQFVLKKIKGNVNTELHFGGTHNHFEVKGWGLAIPSKCCFILREFAHMEGLVSLFQY